MKKRVNKKITQNNSFSSPNDLVVTLRQTFVKMFLHIHELRSGHGEKEKRDISSS